MPNNRFNKQVTPKGYKLGGKVKGEAKVKAIYESVRDKNQPMKLQRMKDKFRAKKMGGGMMKRPMMKEGGKTLKPVNPQTQKGLSKLPTEVRNKMGYMKKGGEVKKLMTPKERAEYVKKAKVSLGATAKSLMDKNQPKKRDRLFQKYGK